MSKKKVTLEEAKEILGSDKIFYNGNKKFNVLDIGKYASGITIEVPEEWTINKERKPESPINYRQIKELTNGMNIDFDGDASVLFGKYRMSKNGNPVFEITEPTKAQHTMIKVSWGGPFNRTSGNHSEYANEVGAIFFRKRSSNGGGAGDDYWIVPVDFAKDIESRDVSSILERVEEEENKRIAQIDESIAQEDAEKKDSIDNRERILNIVQPIIENIKKYNSEFQYKAQEEYFIYNFNNSWQQVKSRYTDELVVKLEELLEQEKSKKKARDTYKPVYQDIENVLTALNITIDYEREYVSIDIPNENSSSKRYEYSQDGYNALIKYVTEYQEELERIKEESRQKAEELKRATELKIKKDEAKEKGYPEVFEFWNRLQGATNLGHAFVIECDGTIREPDYNNLRNDNHKFRYFDWINSADGNQGYIQILPGEIIISYTKAYTAVPYIFNVEWADGNISEAQLETINEKLAEKAGFAIDNDGKVIEDFENWVINETKRKAEECKKKLAIQEESDNLYVTDISKLAKEKVEAEEINKQAKELKEQYEKQLDPDQKKEDD